MTAAPVSRGRAWWATAVLALLMASSMADRQAIAILIQPIKADLRIDDFGVSLLLGPAFAVFYVAFAAPFGWAADRFRRFHVAAAAVLLWSVAAMGSGLATSFAALFVMRAMVGLGEAGLAPAGQSLLGDLFPRERIGLPIAVLAIGIPIGAALGVLGAGAVLSAGARGAFGGWSLHPWQIALVAVGAPGMLLAALALTIREPARARRPEAEPLWPYLRARVGSLCATMFAMAFASMALQALSNWAPEYMRRSFGASPAQIGAQIGGVVLLAALIGQLGTGWLADRLRRSGRLDAPLRLYLFVLPLVVPALIGAFRAPIQAGFLAGLFCLMVLLLPSVPLGAAAMQVHAPPALRGRLAGAYSIVVNLIAFLLGPPAVGALSRFVFGEARLAESVGWVVGVASVATMLLLAVAVRPPRSVAAPVSPGVVPL